MGEMMGMMRRVRDGAGGGVFFLYGANLWAVKMIGYATCRPMSGPALLEAA
jgi:hypothetical protein